MRRSRTKEFIYKAKRTKPLATITPRQRECDEMVQADPFVVRLFETITLARNVERSAWTRLAEHLSRNASP